MAKPMVTDYVNHDEAMIQNFMNEPDYADYYLQAVLADGSPEERSKVQSWYDEAKARLSIQGYWASLIENAEQTAKSGYNLEATIGLVSRALAIMKAALPASA
ncbi:MAG: hypothetical protein IJS28_06865 [Synergistaceae bacterium]|nr:hypothetical protein [Synergistaceae bacterium]